MSTTKLREQISKLEATINAIEERISSLQADAAEATDVERQAELQAAEDTLCREHEANTRALAAARRALAEAENEEKTEAARNWREELAPVADLALITSRDAVIDKLAEARTAFDNWHAEFATWRQRRAELGNPDPKISQPPSTFEDFITVNRLALRTHPASHALDWQRRILRILSG